MREYLYIDEVPDIVMKAIQLKIPSGIYNIEGSENFTIKEIANLIMEVTGFNKNLLNFNSLEKWDTGMKILMLDGSKLEGLIGLKSCEKLKDTLKEYLISNKL
ncbi:MAG: hypothetical protein IPH57_12750 [Saprospiraceae bacterium]|nr:hypothetical protein [Saprospiraceae bacterium]